MTDSPVCGQNLRCLPLLGANHFLMLARSYTAPAMQMQQSLFHEDDLCNQSHPIDFVISSACPEATSSDIADQLMHPDYNPVRGKQTMRRITYVIDFAINVRAG